MKKSVIIAGRALALLSIIFLAITVWQRGARIPAFNFSLMTGTVLIIYIVFSASATGVGSYAWRILLSSGGVSIDFKKAFIIMGNSQIAKYLPGNIFQYVGRVALGKRRGVPAEATMLTIGIETLLLIFSAIAIVVLGLFFDTGSSSHAVSKVFAVSRFSFAVGMLLFLLAALSALVFPGVRRWMRVRAAYLKPAGILQSAVLYSIVFCGYGLLIGRLLNAAWGGDFNYPWYHFIWGYTLAWVAGFVVPGAPGGLGIREAVFVELYGRDLGVGLAVGLATILRVLTSAGDLVTFTIAHWLARNEGRETSE